jgi:hypothetical protein
MQLAPVRWSHPWRSLWRWMDSFSSFWGYHQQASSQLLGPTSFFFLRNSTHQFWSIQTHTKLTDTSSQKKKKLTDTSQWLRSKSNTQEQKLHGHPDEQRTTKKATSLLVLASLSIAAICEARWIGWEALCLDQELKPAAAKRLLDALWPEPVFSGQSVPTIRCSGRGRTGDVFEFLRTGNVSSTGRVPEARDKEAEATWRRQNKWRSSPLRPKLNPSQSQPCQIVKQIALHSFGRERERAGVANQAQQKA